MSLSSLPGAGAGVCEAVSRQAVGWKPAHGPLPNHALKRFIRLFFKPGSGGRSLPLRKQVSMGSKRHITACPYHLRGDSFVCLKGAGSSWSPKTETMC